MTTERLIAVALIVLCCAPITLILLRDRIRRAFQRVTSRLSVEVVRHRTRHGRHTETRAQARRADDQWAIQLHDIAADLDPLPLYDEGIAVRERYRREAWAATGVTQAEYWASVAPPSDLPGPAVRYGQSDASGAVASSSPRGRAGEPTPNQAAGYWTERDIREALPARTIALLERVQPGDTAIERDHTTLTPYIEGLAGGDPWNGKGSQDAYLDWLFTPVGAR